jgi:hypothetical protein
LPYAPEPNLFIDALPVLMGAKIHFGKGAAEFTNLGKDANRFLGAELEEYYAMQHRDAPEPIEIEKTTPSHEIEFSFDKFSLDPNEGEFMNDDVPTLEIDKDEIRERLNIDAQTGRHPLRGVAFLTDFAGGSIETDLSRLALDFLTKGQLKQSHAVLTPVVDRLYQDKPSKKGVSLSSYRKDYRKQPYEKREPLRPFTGKPHAIDDANQEILGSKATNTISESVSAKIQSATFGKISVGIQPSHKVLATHSVALTNAMEQLYRWLSYLRYTEGGTPPDGNCLYHAVNQARGQHASAEGAIALRREVVAWAMHDTNLHTVVEFANQHAVDFIDLINKIQRNGNWEGRAGDLAPRMVASAINRTIEIKRPFSIQGPIVVPPLGQQPAPQGERIIIYLHASHYSINPPQASKFG